MLEKTIEISLLFDFYGELLTERQQQIIELYYLHDLSLSEIAAKLDISRQGVYDHLYRGEQLLHKYEDKLGLVKKYRGFKAELNQLTQYIIKTFDKLKDEKDNEHKYHNFKLEIRNKINRIKNQL